MAVRALEVRQDSGAPATPDDPPPFEPIGTIDSVTVDLGGWLIRNAEQEMGVTMSRE